MGVFEGWEYVEWGFGGGGGDCDWAGGRGGVRVLRQGSDAVGEEEDSILCVADDGI